MMVRKRKVVTAIAALLMVLMTAACGGFLSPQVGFGGWYSVTPKSATLPPGGIVEIEIQLVEIFGDSFFFTVDGGSISGTIVVNSQDSRKAVYTAPGTPGQYIVRAGFTENIGEIRTSLVTITVE